MKKTKEKLFIVLPDALIGKGKNNAEFIIPCTIVMLAMMVTAIYELSLPKFAYLALLFPLLYCLYLLVYFKSKEFSGKVKELIHESNTDSTEKTKSSEGEQKNNI